MANKKSNTKKKNAVPNIKLKSKNNQNYNSGKKNTSVAKKNTNNKSKTPVSKNTVQNKKTEFEKTINKVDARDLKTTTIPKKVVEIPKLKEITPVEKKSESKKKDLNQQPEMPKLKALTVESKSKEDKKSIPKLPKTKTQKAEEEKEIKKNVINDKVVTADDINAITTELIGLKNKEKKVDSEVKEKETLKEKETELSNHEQTEKEKKPVEEEKKVDYIAEYKTKIINWFKTRKTSKKAKKNNKSKFKLFFANLFHKINKFFKNIFVKKEKQVKPKKEEKKVEKSENNYPPVLVFALFIVIILFTIFATLVMHSRQTNYEIETGLNNALKDQKVKGLRFSNTKITVDEGNTSFHTLLTNKSSGPMYIDVIYVTVYNDKKEVLATFNFDVKRELKQNAIKEVTYVVEADLSTAYEIEYSF